MPFDKQIKVIDYNLNVRWQGLRLRLPCILPDLELLTRLDQERSEQFVVQSSHL